MNKKSIISTVAGLVLLGPALAAADCPAFLNSEEGVPCIVAKTVEAAPEAASPKHHPAMPEDGEQRNANVEAWKMMVQNDK